MKTFSTYPVAFNNAVDLANDCKRDVGLGKSREFGKEVFSIQLLPNPENRTGHELNLEVVKPETPKMEIK